MNDSRLGAGVSAGSPAGGPAGFRDSFRRITLGYLTQIVAQASAALGDVPKEGPAVPLEELDTARAELTTDGDALALTMRRLDGVAFRCTVDPRMAHALSDDLLRAAARAMARGRAAE